MLAEPASKETDAIANRSVFFEFRANMTVPACQLRRSIRPGIPSRGWLPCEVVNGVANQRHPPKRSRSNCSSETLKVDKRPVFGAIAPLARGAGQDVHQLRNLAALIGRIAACDRVFDAVGDVVAEHLFLDAAQSSPHGRYLRDDVNAIPAFLHHLGEAAHLTFDAAQAFETSGLCRFLHALTHTLWGYIPSITMVKKSMSREEAP